jgi:hypothetical protein
VKRKPELHLRGARAKGIAAVSLAMLGFTGLALAQVTPAMADPTQVYVATGSDTIQDVMNQFGLDAAGNTVGSYNAVNPVTGAAHEIITPVKATTGTNCSFARPNGSGEGVAALRFSVNSASGATPPTPSPQAGCVDIARSSSPPGNNQSNTGQFVYVPFALDGVTVATGPATGGTVGGVATVATNLTSANSFTLANLQSLYACNNVTVGGITYNPNTAAAGQQQIDLYIPQSGSGTRTFWAGQMLISPTTLPACVHDTIVAGTLTGGIVEEHDGKAVATDPNGFGPFSISQWIGQRNGHNDRRHGALLQNINAISPFANGLPTGNLNTAFPIIREVYNVVQFSRISGGSADAGLVALLSGTNSLLCQDSLQIHSYGFATLSASTPDTCGAVTSANRAFATG